MTYFASKHGKGLQNTLTAIREHTAFKTGGALYAVRMSGAFVLPSAGQLPEVERQRLNDEPPSYIVLSYNTPIAWFVADGGWYVPEVKYSATTSAHQSVVRRAIAGL
jgi:hypothetical protein